MYHVKSVGSDFPIIRRLCASLKCTTCERKVNPVCEFVKSKEREEERIRKRGWGGGREKELKSGRRREMGRKGGREKEMKRERYGEKEIQKRVRKSERESRRVRERKFSSEKVNRS